MKWDIIFSDVYKKWFHTLPQKDKMAIMTDIKILGNMGPSLGRPYVDTIKDSNINNLKEYRSLFFFDPNRKAFFLCGGDKKGKNQQRFYKKLIDISESVFQKYNGPFIKDKE